MRKLYQLLFAVTVFSLPTIASAQSFRVQCPASTITHPDPQNQGLNNSAPPYNGPTQFTVPTTTVGGVTQQTGFYTPVQGTVNGAIMCQQISGGDGLMTEADGTQTFMFAFGPLSGLADVAAGKPSTQFPNVFNTVWPGCVWSNNSSENCAPSATLSGLGPLRRGDPATTDGATSGASPWTLTNPPTVNPVFTWNGAVGLAPDVVQTVVVSDLVEGPVAAASATATVPGCPTTAAAAAALSPPVNINNIVSAWTDSPSGFVAGQSVLISNATAEGGTLTPAGYANNPPTTPATWTVSCVATGSAMSPGGFLEYAFQYVDNTTGLASDTGNNLAAMASTPPLLDGHVDPRQIMDIGVMNGSIPAPLSAFDEDSEFFLTLTNVGMIMRPDLFEQHTVHFHGYPNASSFYDGVPDASIAINIGASFTYYYLAPDAGTYFWHCHITPPEHLQMGMVSQLHVRPRQDRVPAGKSLYTYLGYQNGILTGLPAGTVADLRTECNPGRDILCSASMPAVQNTYIGARSATNPTSGAQGNDLVGNPQRYTYNDGDGSTAYDVEYPIQMHGFDPNFHFVGMTFNPELFVDMKDKYFLLNGRSYPDTVAPGPQATNTTDGAMHYSQPLPSIVNIPVGGKALLRLVNLSVTEYHTLQSVGIPMHEVGFMAKLLRDQAGNNTEFWTNSITLGGGESLDVILDASDDGCSAYAGVGCSAKLYPAGSTFYLYTPQLDHLSNDAENFGGMMTEVHICNSVVPAGSPTSVGSTFGNTCN